MQFGTTTGNSSSTVQCPPGYYAYGSYCLQEVSTTSTNVVVTTTAVLTDCTGALYYENGQCVYQTPTATATTTTETVSCGVACTSTTVITSTITSSVSASYCGSETNYITIDCAQLTVTSITSTGGGSYANVGDTITVTGTLLTPQISTPQTVDVSGVTGSNGQVVFNIPYEITIAETRSPCLAGCYYSGTLDARDSTVGSNYYQVAWPQQTSVDIFYTYYLSVLRNGSTPLVISSAVLIAAVVVALAVMLKNRKGLFVLKGGRR